MLSSHLKHHNNYRYCRKKVRGVAIFAIQELYETYYEFCIDNINDAVEQWDKASDEIGDAGKS